MTLSLEGTQEAKRLWSAALGQLQLQVTRPSYETWLKDTVGVDTSDGELVVSAPNAFVAEMLEQRMYSLISQSVERVARGHTEVRFQVMSGDAVPAPSYESTPTATEPVSVLSDPVLPPPSLPNGNGASRRAIALNRRYAFETFVVGKSNELAHAASLAVSEKPGVVYNPLTIYSDVGLGKTHLLHAIGQRAQARGLSVIYATTEEFTNEYIRAIREGATEEFRDRYRGTDVLLLDDIQFLIGKEQTQEGFFHTFNSLHMINK